MKRRDTFPIPPIFGYWVVDAILPEQLGRARPVTPHVYPIGTRIQLVAASYTVLVPGAAAAVYEHAITLVPLGVLGSLLPFVRERGGAPDDLAYQIDLSNKTTLDGWVGPDDKAYVHGLVEREPGEPSDVAMVWSRRSSPE